MLTIEELRKLPEDGEGPCVYFLWLGDTLQYIGATRDRGERIARHWRDYRYRSAQSGNPIPFDRETYLDCADDKMWDLEAEYQKKLDPPFNVVSYRRRAQ